MREILQMELCTFNIISSTIFSAQQFGEVTLVFIFLHKFFTVSAYHFLTSDDAALFTNNAYVGTEQIIYSETQYR
jgi:hypothetical protein